MQADASSWVPISKMQGYGWSVCDSKPVNKFEAFRRLFFKENDVQFEPQLDCIRVICGHEDRAVRCEEGCRIGKYAGPVDACSNPVCRQGKLIKTSGDNVSNEWKGNESIVTSEAIFSL